MFKTTRFWVQYRKSQYRGSTTYKRWFKNNQALEEWRKTHPNNRYYTELSHA